jgi:GT2 family glycosyltransferase
VDDRTAPRGRGVSASGGDPEGAADILVITPTLGRRRETLAESVASLRLQSVGVRHVVVAPRGVDLGIDDVEVVVDPGRGLSAAFNAGLARAGSEEFVYWLNDDDRVAPGGLDRLVTRLDAAPGAAAVIGAVLLVDDKAGRVARLGGGGLAVRLLSWGPGMMASPGVLHRTDLVRALGGLDERLVHAGDLDLLLRASTVGPLLATREVVGEFRWHAGSLTVGDPLASLDEAEAVRRRHHARRSSTASRAYAVWRPVARALTRTAKAVVTARAGAARGRH